VSLYDSDIKNAPIGKDLWSAQLPTGMYLSEGRTFTFEDRKLVGGAYAYATANALTVVSGTPASVNEIQVGYYSCGQLCDRINAWLGGELAATRIYGHYNFQSPVSSNTGVRTKCYWTVNHGSDVPVGWKITCPGEVGTFLGLTDEEGDLRGQQVVFGVDKGSANRSRLLEGKLAPCTTLVFHPGGPGRLAQEFNNSTPYATQDASGAFVDQYDLLPYAVKGSCVSTERWGIFLFDENVLIVGSYDDSDPTAPILKNCWVAPFQFTETSGNDALSYVCRRVDEPEAGPITMRQVLILEQTWLTIMLYLFYSTGTTGYNHATYDELGYGIGMNIPGSLLGPEFERSLENMPGAKTPMVVIITKPTKFSDLFTNDLIVRWAFVRWRDQGFEFAQWRTPIASAAAKSYAGTSLALTEANKAAPSGHNDNHRIASIESDEHIRPVIRINYARFFGDQSAKYTKSRTIEDPRAVDDAGGGSKVFAIDLRHSFAELSQTGAAVETLANEFIVKLPMASRANRKIVRTISPEYYEGYAVGDIVGNVTDTFARDPVTGERGMVNRPAVITKLAYNPGGPSWIPGAEARKHGGEVELMFLDLQRGRNYAPCAEVDETQTNGGYDALGPTLTCYSHKYSHDLVALNLRRGDTADDTEEVDATNFPAGTKIHIIEMDPANPASPTTWERTVLSQTGDTITLTVALSAPAWDASKKYRIVPQKYSQVVAAQQDVAYQGDDDDHLVEDDEPPWDYSSGGRGLSFVEMTGTEPAEFVPEVAYGDGRPYDPGFDHALAFTANAYIDHKSAHQAPFLVDANSVPIGTPGSTDWELLYIFPLFLGTEHGTSTVKRYLTVAPQFYSVTGASCSLRVSIGRTMPREGVGALTGAGTYYQNPTFTDAHASSSVWTTSSTTEQTGARASIEINCKDLSFGYVYVIVEVMGDMYCRGLPDLCEGPRVVS
jgi:hypothetical protein